MLPTPPLPPFDPRVVDWLIDLSRSRDALPTAGRWRCLEAAHVLGQARFMPHLRTHWAMLSLAWRTRDGREMAGQVFRLALVPLGHLLGRLPLGNPGRANVSAFQPFPVREDLRHMILALSKAGGLDRRHHNGLFPGDG